MYVLPVLKYHMYAFHNMYWQYRQYIYVMSVLSIHIMKCIHVIFHNMFCRYCQYTLWYITCMHFIICIGNTDNTYMYCQYIYGTIPTIHICIVDIYVSIHICNIGIVNTYYEMHTCDMVLTIPPESDGIQYYIYVHIYIIYICTYIYNRRYSILYICTYIYDSTDNTAWIRRYSILYIYVLYIHIYMYNYVQVFNCIYMYQ